jgi:hypothetical protein
MGSIRLGRRITASASVVLCVGLLLSCDVALDTTATKTKEPEILSVSLEQGAALKPGDLIEVTVNLPETASETTPATGPESDPTSGAAAPAAETVTSAYSVEVQLETSGGVLITSRSFPYRDGDVLAPLTLDDLGLQSQGYRLLVRLMHGDEELASRIVDFTYLGDEYELREITSDAPSIHPGSTVALTAVLTVPEGSNPYMEWSWAEGVFAKGNLQEGLDTVRWTSPPVEGIYTITARLYPLGAESASVPLSADIYVSVVKDPLGELGPPASYRGLYHLLGDLEDSSPEMASGSFIAGAQPLQLITRGRIVGYQLDGAGGFSVPVFLLPEREGLLEPFTISFGFTPPQEPTVGRLLRVATADGQLELTVDFTDTSIVAEMRSAEAARRIEAAA